MKTYLIAFIIGLLTLLVGLVKLCYHATMQPAPWKVPLREVWCGSFWIWLKNVVWCHWLVKWQRRGTLAALLLSLAVPLTMQAQQYRTIPVASTLLVTNTVANFTNGVPFSLPKGVQTGKPVTFMLTFTPGATNSGALLYTNTVGFNFISQDGTTRSTTLPLLLTNYMTGTNNSLGSAAVTTWNVIAGTNFNGAASAALDYAATTYTNFVTITGQITWDN